MTIVLLCVISDRQCSVVREMSMRYKDLQGGTNVLKCCLDIGSINFKSIFGVWVVFLWKWLLVSLCLIVRVKLNKLEWWLSL